MPTPTSFTPSSLIPYGVEAGLGFIGSKLANHPANQQNQWSRQLMEQQLARQRALQGIALPSMIRALGYRDPTQIQQMVNSVNNPTPSGFANVPQGTSSGGSTAGAIGKTALGLAPLAIAGAKAAFTGPALTAVNPVTVPAAHGLLPMLGHLASNPWTIGAAGALGAGLAAKHFIHEGAHAANKFVGNSENVLGETMARVSRGEGTPEEFKQAYQQYQQQAQAAIQKGGNEGRVAQQSLNNSQLQQTIQRLAQQLNIPLGAA